MERAIPKPILFFAEFFSVYFSYTTKHIIFYFQIMLHMKKGCHHYWFEWSLIPLLYHILKVVLLRVFLLKYLPTLLIENFLIHPTSIQVTLLFLRWPFWGFITSFKVTYMCISYCSYFYCRLAIFLFCKYIIVRECLCLYLYLRFLSSLFCVSQYYAAKRVLFYCWQPHDINVSIINLWCVQLCWFSNFIS